MSFLGRKHTLESREKIRQGNLGKKLSLETRIKIGQSNSRRRLSPETKAKIARTMSCNWKNEEFRNKVIDGATGRHLSPEHREKLRLIGLGRPHPPTSEETREKNRQSRLRQRFLNRMTSIEILLRDEFNRRNFQFEMHKTMFGRFQPDFVFSDVNLIVQADGEYWHSLPNRIKDDCEFNAKAKDEGWEVIRFTDSEIKNDLIKCVERVSAEVNRRTRPSNHR